MSDKIKNFYNIIILNIFLQGYHDIDQFNNVIKAIQLKKQHIAAFVLVWQKTEMKQQQ